MYKKKHMKRALLSKSGAFFMECHYKIAPSAPFLKEELLSLDEKNKEAQWIPIRRVQRPSKEE